MVNREEQRDHHSQNRVTRKGVVKGIMKKLMGGSYRELKVMGTNWGYILKLPTSLNSGLCDFSFISPRHHDCCWRSGPEVPDCEE